MEGMDGIETARKLRKSQEETVLIFVTAMKEYVFEALDLYAFQYLLKPVDETKFAEVLERAVREAARKQEKRGLFIKTRNLTLDQADILYIESRGKKVEIHTAGEKENIEIYGTMEGLEGTGYLYSHDTEVTLDEQTISNLQNFYHEERLAYWASYDPIGPEALLRSLEEKRVTMLRKQNYGESGEQNLYQVF